MNNIIINERDFWDEKFLGIFTKKKVRAKSFIKWLNKSILKSISDNNFKDYQEFKKKLVIKMTQGMFFGCRHSCDFYSNNGFWLGKDMESPEYNGIKVEFI